MSEQNKPVERGHDDATDEERVAGIVEQTRADIARGGVHDVRDAVAQRLKESGVPASGDEFERILAEVTGGPTPSIGSVQNSNDGV